MRECVYDWISASKMEASRASIFSHHTELIKSLRNDIVGKMVLGCGDHKANYLRLNWAQMRIIVSYHSG